jgi:hypothetical protein
VLRSRAMLGGWGVLLFVGVVEREVLDVHERTVRDSFLFGAVLCEADLLWAWAMSGFWWMRML